jgi:Mrp family chromosome partitioning ATPase/capsular polysaccharide biosynthesis protein
LRRRWWLVLLIALAVPAAAYYFSTKQEKLYTASAEVLVSSQNPLPTSLGGGQGTNDSLDAARNLDTLARVAEVPTVASLTLQSLGVTSINSTTLRAETTVSADPNSDILTFQVTNRSPALAVRLANGYAQQFINYRTSLQTAVITNALVGLSARIKALQHTLTGRSPQSQSVTVRQQLGVLLSNQQDLQSARALQGGNLLVVQSATSAPQTQPKTARNVALALLLGLVLGLGLAFMANALDNRARSAEEVAAALGMALLARVPEPPRKLRRQNRLAMLNDKPGEAGEAYRKLRTNFDFANLTASARTVLVTSAVEKEGKSTTVANLAIAMARGGKCVILIDLDLRRPILARFFALDGRPGITEVVLGRVSLSQALVKVSLPGISERAEPSSNGKAAAGAPGWLQVLPAGIVQPDPAEFVGTRGLAEMLLQLRELADVVLIDAPPLLPVSDAMTLSSEVDGVVLIARAGAVHRGMLSEVQRLLSSIPATKLGFVLTNSQADSKYGYGGYYGGYSSTTKAPAPDMTRESLR